MPGLKSLGKARFLQNANRSVSGSDLDRHDDPLSLSGYPDIVIAISVSQKEHPTSINRSRTALPKSFTRQREHGRRRAQ